METFTPLTALAGGALIGLAASVLLLFHGRVAGISGVLGETLQGHGMRGEGSFRIAFLGGLLLAGVALRVFAPSVFGDATASSAHWPLVIGAGLLVGYGTRLGGGCTSGHGVCGISRLSVRSIVATMTFMVVAGVTVFVVHHRLGGGP